MGTLLTISPDRIIERDGRCVVVRLDDSQKMTAYIRKYCDSGMIVVEVT